LAFYNNKIYKCLLNTNYYIFIPNTKIQDFLQYLEKIQISIGITPIGYTPPLNIYYLDIYRNIIVELKNRKYSSINTPIISLQLEEIGFVN
jgi:hypothetical protein